MPPQSSRQIESYERLRLNPIEKRFATTVHIYESKDAFWLHRQCEDKCTVVTGEYRQV